MREKSQRTTYTAHTYIRQVTLGLILCLPLWALSQAPIYNGDKINSISRIDSLTLDLFKADTTLNDKINALEVPITAELFEYKMAQLGSSFQFSYHPDIAQQIRFMTNPASKFMAKTYPRSQVYLPIFEEVLDKRKLPEEIKFLSVIESALNPNAVSWVGAAGLWQFMPGTGKLMNLEINHEIDERKDILKSTEKALSYLESMYRMYGDWYMALAAYNCGPGNLNKAVKKAGGSKDYWVVRKYLPKETQGYVPKFIAAVFVMNFVDLQALFSCEERFCRIVSLELKAPLSLSMASAFLHWDEDFIQEYNAFYKYDFVPSSYSDKRIYLPYYAAMQFLEMEDSLYAIQQNYIQSSPVSRGVQKVSYHKVQKGETLYKIASKYGVDATDIKKWNNLKSNTLPLGRNLKIIKTVQAAGSPTALSSSFAYYVVSKESESLQAICNKINNCSLEASLVENEILSEEELLPRGTLIKIVAKLDLP